MQRPQVSRQSRDRDPLDRNPPSSSQGPGSSTAGTREGVQPQRGIATSPARVSVADVATPAVGGHRARTVLAILGIIMLGTALVAFDSRALAQGAAAFHPSVMSSGRGQEGATPLPPQPPYAAADAAATQSRGPRAAREAEGAPAHGAAAGQRSEGGDKKASAADPPQKAAAVPPSPAAVAVAPPPAAAASVAASVQPRIPSPPPPPFKQPAAPLTANDRNHHLRDVFPTSSWVHTLPRGVMGDPLEGAPQACAPLRDGVWDGATRASVHAGSVPGGGSLGAYVAANPKQRRAAQFLPTSVVSGFPALPRLRPPDVNASSEPSYRLWRRVAPERPTRAQVTTGTAPNPLGWPVMTNATLARACADYNPAAEHFTVKAAFVPRGACGTRGADTDGGEPAGHHPNVYPWDRRVDLVSYDCALITNAGGGVIAWSVVTPSAVVSWVEDWKGLPDIPAVEELGAIGVVGATWHASLPGHALNQVLPRLLFLDAHLPLSVPLLLPPMAPIIDFMHAAGVFTPGRRVIYSDRDGTILRARRVFTVNSPDMTKGPCLTFYTLAATAQRLWAMYRPGGIRADAAAAAASAASSGPILVLGRRGMRALTNTPALVAALRARFPKREVLAFEPGSKGWPLNVTLAQVARAAAIVGPHGANMANVLAAPPDAAVVEVGYTVPPQAIGKASGWPSSMNGVARMAGMRYFPVLAKDVSPDAMLLMEVDVAEVVGVLGHALEGGVLP